MSLSKLSSSKGGDLSWTIIGVSGVCVVAVGSCVYLRQRIKLAQRSTTLEQKRELEPEVTRAQLEQQALAEHAPETFEISQSNSTPANNDLYQFFELLNQKREQEPEVTRAQLEQQALAEHSQETFEISQSNSKPANNDLYQIFALVCQQPDQYRDLCQLVELLHQQSKVEIFEIMCEQNLHLREETVADIEENMLVEGMAHVDSGYVEKACDLETSRECDVLTSLEPKDMKMNTGAMRNALHDWGFALQRISSCLLRRLSFGDNFNQSLQKSVTAWCSLPSRHGRKMLQSFLRVSRSIYGKRTKKCFNVCIEEFTMAKGEKPSCQCSTLSTAHYQALWERHLAEGMRPSFQTAREWKVILPKVDEWRNPVDRVLDLPEAAISSDGIQPSLGSAGSAKPSFGRARSDADGAYGEDVAFTACWTFGDGISVSWLMVADGHGGCGADTAKRAQVLFGQKWQELSPSIVKLTQDRRFDDAKKLMQEQGYDVVVRAIEHEAACNGWTGSTITQMLTVTTREGRRIVYTSNMGDSPAAIMVIDGARAAQGPKVFVTSCAHNWDDQDEVQRYADNVWLEREAAREHGKPYEHICPSPVCYQAFNCHGSGAVLEDIKGNRPGYDRGRQEWIPLDPKTGLACEPILMWKYMDRKNKEGELDGWDVHLDSKAAEHVWRAAAAFYGDNTIGGVQADAAKEVLVCGEEARPFRPAAPEKNWGSCVLVGESQRGCQVTRGIADVREREICHTSDQASFMVFELYPNEEAIQIVMSDGIERVAGLQELADELNLHCLQDECNRDGQALAKKVMTIVEKRHGPKYDDCSVAVAYSPGH